MKIKGFDKLNKRLNNMQKAAKELEGSNEMPFSELFPNSFLREYTNFTSFEEFQNHEIFNKYQTIKEIPDDEMDQFVSANSVFSDWKEMLNKASTEYASRKVGF